MMRTGAEIVMDCLERHGVQVVAGMPGGANLPLYDALAQSRIRHVLVRHEQAAGFIAQGFARASGRTGVCLATSGPGATNLVTALADARMDSVPVVAITGQVPTGLLGTDAFQEVDTVSIMAPVVKRAIMVRHVDELSATLDDAFAFAASGRPGPVLVDIPKDVQQARASIPAAPAQPALPAGIQCASDDQLARCAELIATAERPILYVGGGVALSGAHGALAALAHRQDIPVTCTLMGLGCFDPDDPLYLGMLGMHAAPFTNLLMREADLLLAVGARFDDRATGKLSEFCPRARTVHIDIDAREIGKLRGVELGIAADARSVLEQLLPRLDERARPRWRARLASLRERHPLPCPTGPHSISALFGCIAGRLDAETLVTTDVGQHQMWAAQLLPFRRPRQLLTSGGLGSMGFGLPAAIGAALADRGRVICVSGDGSLLLNIHELATLAELDLDVTIVLLDNRHLGLVRQQQMLFYGQRLSAAHLAHATDFVAVARGFGIEAVSLPPAPDRTAALDALLTRRGPRLIHIPIDAAEMVLPMVPSGAGNHEMLGAALTPSSLP
jgi:acetolactate synthase I/II/III large subunit